MHPHAPMQRLSSYAEEVVTDSLYVNHPTYQSPVITQLSSSEASSPVLGQVLFDVAGEKPRRKSVTVTVSDNVFYDKLNISATRSTAIELLPIPSPQMTVTKCERYPIKQEYSSFSDSESEDSVTPKKKRVRSLVKSTASENKAPGSRHPCRVLGCKVTCSSLPSLLRHAETHKWKGSYTPIRCEACQRALCNEYSVQRHIVNSKPTSRCYRMRVYSVMKSKTEVETTVRFYPLRSHGKKTVRIDLEYARAKY
ncbi:hypothetical protein BGX26_009425 [Mortierella sp. AD094]|nr:hypothetical protein BGX26_009425 [Mortierella sp. AD094]